MWRRVLTGRRASAAAARDESERQATDHEDVEDEALDVVVAPPPVSMDAVSVMSNPSVSSYNSSTRQRAYHEVAHSFFGSQSETSEVESTDEELISHDDDEPRARIFRRAVSNLHLPPPTSSQVAARKQRRENARRFETLVHFANTNQPVTLQAFKKSSFDASASASARPSSSESQLDQKTQLNTELIEAYVAYARSIGREPEIQVTIGDPVSDDDEDELAVEGRAYVHAREQVEPPRHCWTPWLGTRFSKQRGCVQFWMILAVGVVLLTIMIVWLSQVAMDEVLHLDAFANNDVVVLQDDFAYLHLRDEVGFDLRYEIRALAPQPDGRSADFQVLLLTEDNFERYVEGESFSFIAQGSILRTTQASLPLTRIENVDHDEMYLVVQPCFLPSSSSSNVSYCQTTQLPAPVASRKKLFALHKLDLTQTDSNNSPRPFYIANYYVNPMPDTCSESGTKGAAYLVMFIPYVLVSLFGLRLFQMALHCESFRSNLERTYKHEFEIPEAEVDYWQPVPWDRKVPKTRLLGPCCWKKMRRPTEPFYTWWRHENYFTWIFFPYRNEQLSRGERAIIIFCSLYVTFYVTFVVAMVFGAWHKDKQSTIGSWMLYWVLLTLLPTLGKAIFKEIFKLIFRQRRAFFRLKARGGDTSRFSFRVAFLLQVLVVVCITLAQAPLLYIWLRRSCVFLSQFLYFGSLAAVMRLSVMGLALDYFWYVVIRTWGWRDLCPYCTERIVHCECCNDELLALAVERVGAKWELIQLLDQVLSRHAGQEPQLASYTPEQLHERWSVLVERARAHMEKVEKLRVYQIKKRRDQARKKRRTLLGPERLSFIMHRRDKDERLDEESVDVTEYDEEEDELLVGCHWERKILALEAKIQLGRFEKHYDSTIVDIFKSMQYTLRRGLSTSRDDEDKKRSMWETPGQRQVRREEERTRRERAFDVLHDYRIEEQREDGRAESIDETTDRSWLSRWWQRSKRDSRHESLIPMSRKSRKSAEKTELVIVVTQEDWFATKTDAIEEKEEQKEEEDEEEEVVVVVEEEEEEEEPASPRHRRSPRQRQQQHSRAFAVTEIPKTYWEQLSESVTAGLQWAFKYDSSQF
ncbi:hypothetical protein Poli38472_007192 [Pythium oligandrum]|uniref:Transmembrane protein n=1 Tax=Pythium oligandrum TaxID=41045 RepID=A0A8K1C9I0_PYTOL|nr:hypothetical protein Poli38472_007192 [Pythium oligandrum]|eukprot:TMW59047.1 hypothetical protein Poli38472_007192 [Pythium oligandrum]